MRRGFDRLQGGGVDKRENPVEGAHDVHSFGCHRAYWLCDYEEAS
jgi:hypothetical protein